MNWLPVKRYEGKYEVNNLGVVRTVCGRILKQFENNQGYVLVRVSNPRALLRVHRIVAEVFLENNDNFPFVNHIDCNRANNITENLEWCTQKQNLAHSDRLGRMQRDYWVGKRSPSAKLSDETVAAIRAEYALSKTPYSKLADKFNTNKRTIGRIIVGESYVRT